MPHVPPVAVGRVRSQDVRKSGGSSDSSAGSEAGLGGEQRRRLELELAKEAKKDAEREQQACRRATEEELGRSLGKTLALQRGRTRQEREESARDVADFLKQPTQGTGSGPRHALGEALDRLERAEESDRSASQPDGLDKSDGSSESSNEFWNTDPKL